MYVLYPYYYQYYNQYSGQSQSHHLNGCWNAFRISFCGDMKRYETTVFTNGWRAVILFQPIYRLDNPESYLLYYNTKHLLDQSISGMSYLILNTKSLLKRFPSAYYRLLDTPQ